MESNKPYEYQAKYDGRRRLSIKRCLEDYQDNDSNHLCNINPHCPHTIRTAMQNLCRSQDVLNFYQFYTGKKNSTYPGVYVAHACAAIRHVRSFGYSITSDRELGMALIYTLTDILQYVLINMQVTGDRPSMRHKANLNTIEDFPSSPHPHCYDTSARDRSILTLNLDHIYILASAILFYFSYYKTMELH